MRNLFISAIAFAAASDTGAAQYTDDQLVKINTIASTSGDSVEDVEQQATMIQNLTGEPLDAVLDEGVEVVKEAFGEMAVNSSADDNNDLVNENDAGDEDALEQLEEALEGLAENGDDDGDNDIDA